MQDIGAQWHRGLRARARLLGHRRRVVGARRGAVRLGRRRRRGAARAIRRAVDLGVNFFATADNYGTGHSERCPGARGRGAAGRRRHRHEVGNLFDEETRTAVGGADDSAAYARRALIASLKRLGTNHVDLYPLHIGARGATPERGPRNSLTPARSSCETA